MTCRSTLPCGGDSYLIKVSCLSWNKHAKNHIATSDYEGPVIVQDVNTRQFKPLAFAHESRKGHAQEADMLSSSVKCYNFCDDDLVEVWSMKERKIVAWGEGHSSWVSGVAFDSYWSSPNTDGTDESVMYRFGSVGKDTQLLL